MHTREIAGLLICTALLMLGQLTNIYKAAPIKLFERGLLANGDGYIIGKLAVSEQHGLFTNIAAIAQIIPDTTKLTLTEDQEWEYRKSFFTSYSKDAYINKTPLENVEINYYLSKTALHSFFYNLGNYIFKPIPQNYLQFLKIQKSFLFSLMLSLIIIWVVEFTNIWSGILLLVSLLFSPVMTMMGSTLYFAPFTFYLPFVVATYLLHKDHKGIITFGLKHYIIIGLSFLFHMCFHSFEFISTMGIAAVTPFVFYGIINRLNWKEIIVNLTKASATYFVAIILGTMLLLIQQNVLLQTSFLEGLERIWERYEIRGIGENITLQQIEDETDPFKQQGLKNRFEAQHASAISIIKIFIEDKAIAIYEGNQVLFGLKYLAYLILFGFAWIVTSLLRINGRVANNIARALIVTTMFSFLAPLSWWVLFKPHSFHHSHFVVFVWMLPFTIFGFMLVGHTLSIVTKIMLRK